MGAFQNAYQKLRQTGQEVMARSPEEDRRRIAESLDRAKTAASVAMGSARVSDLNRQLAQARAERDNAMRQDPANSAAIKTRYDESIANIKDQNRKNNYEAYSMLADGKSTAEVQDYFETKINGGNTDAQPQTDQAQDNQTTQSSQPQNNQNNQNTQTQGNQEPQSGQTQNNQNAQSGQTQNNQTQGNQNAQSDNQTQSDQPQGNQTQNNQNTQSSQTQTQGNTMQKKNVPFSASFYRDIGAVAKGRLPGNTYDYQAETQHEMAQRFKNSAANRQMEAQREQQEGDRNPYATQAKDSTVTNDIENRQAVDTSGVIGGGAALERNRNVADINQIKNHAAERRDVAGQYRKTMDDERKRATTAEGQVAQFKVGSRDFNTNYDQSQELSMGGNEVEDGGEEVAEETPIDNTPKTPEEYGTNWHHVLNYITFGNDPSSGWSNDSKDGGAARKFATAQGWQPVTLTQQEYDAQGAAAEGMRQQKVAQQAPEFYSAWQKGSNRFDEQGNQTNVGDPGVKDTSVFEQATVNNVPSDNRVKDIECLLSDERVKYVRDLMDNGLDVHPMLLQRIAGMAPSKFKHNDMDYDINEDWGDEDEESILSSYADHIRNYVYTYKPEATQIDSRIDPNEQHIGPMAQDIEQVNPACVKETPEGVKTVDTQRLSMMNAGAIGDLARELADVKSMLQELLNGR